MRKWGQEEKLKELDAQLMRQKDWGGRRWYVNSQGQTFAVIEGPAEFRMGSPATEPERNETMESYRRTVIPRRFAIAVKEVTTEQWQRFLQTHPQHRLAPSFLKKFSPDSNGPMIGFNWYIAAEYCNWLSEQEGLPRGQWCYLPNEAGAYADRMTIRSNVLDRAGYRLPTEAEWEFACRSGAVTSRYYGHSIELLNAYAWYQADSKEHAWACGRLLPNDLGLFDTLGNEFEWVQDSVKRAMPRKRGLLTDTICTQEYVDDRVPRLLRGGSFGYLPSLVRSASRYRNAASDRSTDIGFRPCRTYR
jgi:formylglycine-generating enzyme required for sulfatase activity